MIRCNNCMKLFKDDDELVKISETQFENDVVTTLYKGEDFDESISSVIDGCPDCLTDEYLMDLE